MLTPSPTSRPHSFVAHEMLALAEDGACIVRIADNDADLGTVYQFRRAGRVVAEASTLGTLATMLDHLDQAANRG